ncbi:hypothetical protein BH09VER1_BH09VER1_22660 [soil metagenome]
MEREILLVVAVIGCIWCWHRARTTGGARLYLLAAFWGIVGANQFVRSRALAVLSIVFLALYWGLGLLRQSAWKAPWHGLQKRPEPPSDEKIIEIEVEEVRSPKNDPKS